MLMIKLAHNGGAPMYNRGNTVGSTTFSFITSDDYYSLGLWLADGYWRASSIGLTSISNELIARFSKFLQKISPDHKLKTRTYVFGKRTHKAFCVYINDRKMTRMFMSFKTGKLNIPRDKLISYLSGRIDGDGHYDQKHRTGIRIAYGNKFDANRDLQLILKFEENSASLYEYKRAKTWVIYLRKIFLQKYLSSLRLYCIKLLPRRD